MQDSHWASGSFGYFPSYLLGTMVACQLHAKLKAIFPDLSSRVESGDLAPVREWLKDNVHQYGRGLSMPEILRRSTGTELVAEHFLALLEERFIR